jgi:hypothetical protein
VESRVEKDSPTLRHERNAQGTSDCEEECALSDEREEILKSALSSVSIVVISYLILFRFLVNMNYAFEDRENLYLVIDMMQGGDLRYHLAKHKKFTEE